MKTPSQVALNERLRGEVAWKLLAAANAPITIALLREHLFDKERRLPSSILNERINRDLEALRAEGSEMPQSAQAYLGQWLADGFLERTYEPGANEEAYELSAGAIRAIRFCEGLTQRRAAATESRLSLVIQSLMQLAEQTETNPESRVESLLRERERIDAEIDAIRGGHLESLPQDRALERAREIIALADDLANDFRRVRDEFEQLNRDLRERIIESEGARGQALEELFVGVDVISESEAGRTFKAFWRLLTDPQQSLEFEEALERLLSREFVGALAREERRFLLRLIRLLLERGGDVHEVLQSFARSLKQFVESHAYLEQRRLSNLLRDAQRLALDIKDEIRPTDEIGHTLYLTSGRLRPLGRYQLYDPSLDKIDSSMLLAEAAEISLEAVSELLAHSEIDFRRLKNNVRALLAERDQVSIADVLDVYPADQGLGSVVGYMALGSREGLTTKSRETVCWRGLDGVERRARIPCIYFVRGHSVEFA